MSMQQDSLRIRRPEALSGQTMTEYALILATVAAVLVALFDSAGTIVNELVNQVGPYL